MSKHPAFLSLILAAASLAAQQPGPPLLHTPTRVIAVPVLVHNSKGLPVRGLTRDSFEIKQDGIPQTVHYLSEDNDLPLTLTLLLDTSTSDKPLIPQEIVAAAVFFRTVLTRPIDGIALVQFDANVVLQAAPTNSLATLDDALVALATSKHHAREDRHGLGGTLFYDALCDASAQLQQQPGRRAIVLLTDGVDNHSIVHLADALECAERAEVTVFSVQYISPEEVEHTGDQGKKALKTLADQTGGIDYKGGSRPLAAIFAEIADNLRAQYQLGFTISPDTPGAYHKLQVKVHGAHLRVDARRGYYVPLPNGLTPKADALPPMANPTLQRR